MQGSRSEQHGDGRRRRWRWLRSRSGDIEKFTLVIVLSSGESFHKWQ
jgi:hypothetical protein